MQKLHRAVTWAARNSETEVTVADMARQAGISRRHFIRRFKQAMGTTPGRYLSAIRILKAKTLLAQTRTPIAHVALDCGFACQSSLTTAFRQACGMTPARYRKQAQPPVETDSMAFCPDCPLREILDGMGRNGEMGAQPCFLPPSRSPSQPANSASSPA